MVEVINLPKVRIEINSDLACTIGALNELRINTICIAGNCPNRADCFAKKKVSVLVLGEICSRDCLFCGVRKGPLGENFDFEVEEIVKLVDRLDLRSIVITSVTRDDLADFGASHFCNIVTCLRKRFPHLKIELLIPDFCGNESLISMVASLNVEIIGHNIETVARLYPLIRSKADYSRSLKVLEVLSKSNNIIKSSIMLGLGETIGEVKQTLKDVLSTGCQAICIGQYLVPQRKVNYPVKRIYPMEVFEELGEFSKKIGFRYVWSGPFVRSSFVGVDDE